jgi:hypothetical protein
MYSRALQGYSYSLALSRSPETVKGASRFQRHVGAFSMTRQIRWGIGNFDSTEVPSAVVLFALLWSSEEPIIPSLLPLIVQSQSTLGEHPP